jgi:hypothetical protein
MILFLWGLDIDAATLTASSETPTLPVGNLQNKQPSKKFRFTGNTSERIVIDFGAGNEVAADALAVISHNSDDDGLIAVQGGSTMASVTGGVPTVDVPSASIWPASGRPILRQWPNYNSLIKWSNTVPLRWWSVTLDNPTNVDPLEIGRLMLCDSFTPKFNVGHALALGWRAAGNPRVTSFNSRYGEKLGDSARKWILPVSSINREDLWTGFSEYVRLLGNTKDLFVCLNPSEDTYLQQSMMQCEFSDPETGFDGQPMFDPDGKCWRVVLNLEELM